MQAGPKQVKAKAWACRALAYARRVYKAAQCGLYQFDVTGLSKRGYVYNPAGDHTSPHTQIVVPSR